jgi:hypothetical protein
MRALERELETELHRRQHQWRYRIQHRRVIFDFQSLREQRAQRIPLWRYVLTARPQMVLTAPIIYGMLVPLLALDVFVTFYQWACFPLYRIARVPRREHFVYDRAHLAYLNAAEKLNCLYCSYANGLASYFREIAARTEQYWCPIKHAKRVLNRHAHYEEFLDYGDARGYRRQLNAVRTRLRR